MKIFTLISVGTFLLFSTITFCQDALYHQTNGFGTDQLAGLSGDVYKVTNLNNDGPGSLRSFIKMSGPRIIVFEVGGIIDLDEEDLTINDGFLTIAGQTAPYPGITIIKGGLRVQANNVVVQHISIRPGDNNLSSSMNEPDGFNVSANNVVFDHCSVSWSIDENMSVSRGGNNITFYRCIVAEGLSNSIHNKGEHSCGTLIMDGSKNISIYGSLYAHNFRRHPRLKEGTQALYANNVVYNYGIYAAHIGGEQGEGYSDNPGKGSFIGNTFLKGADGWGDYFLEGHKGDFDKNMNPGNGEAYLEDNIMLDRGTGNALIPYDQHITPLESPVAMPSEFQAIPARENIERVLKGAGSRPFERNDVDKRIIQSVINGDGSIIDSQSEVGGYPSYAATSRELSVPGDTQDKRAWLDSISITLEQDLTLDASALLSFVDDNISKIPSNISLVNKAIFKLKCAPNPINDKATISFTLNNTSDIQIKLFDIFGKEIAIIKDNMYSPGQHYFSLYPDEYNLSSGLFLMQIKSNNTVETIKISIN